jgi:poly(glycerol-phosphate) alpha-glucosyltransferase
MGGRAMKLAVSSGISRKAGGLFYAVSSLCKELQAKQVELAVYGSSRGFEEEDRKTWSPVSVHPYQAYGPLAFSPELRRQLNRDDADLVHQHGIWQDDQWASHQWQKRTGRPVVVSPHGMLDPWALANSAWKKKIAGAVFANAALKKATCIHALCQSEADSIRAYGLKNPIAIIPNGVELPEIRGQRTEDGGQGTEGGGRKGEKRKLLFLGRIHPKKGLSELIQAWAKVNSKAPNALSDWQLLIAGWDDGNHLEGLKQLASQLGLSWSDETSPSAPRTLTSDLRPLSSDLRPPTSDLCFLGSKFGAEKDALLRSVDAFILPSFSEGLPMSVLEAWSYQLPVLMTEYCNIPEGFAANAALRVEPKVESLTEGLQRLALLDEAQLIQYGQNGRKLVESQFTWVRIAESMKSVYQWCLDGGEAPACLQL